MRHDVAPVAHGVTDAEKDGFVFGARTRQRFFSPKMPVYRVVGVLQQAGRSFMRESVGYRIDSISCRRRLRGFNLFQCRECQIYNCRPLPVFQAETAVNPVEAPDQHSFLVTGLYK
jgi:hypothetical protein